MHRRRLLVLAAVLSTSLVAVPVAGGHRPPGPSEPCGTGQDAVRTRGAWTVVKAPQRLEGEIVAHAAGGPDGRFLLASDGRTVQRSADGGCTWEDSYDAAQDGIPGVGVVDGVTPRVSRLAFPGGGAAGALLVLDGIAGVLGPTILFSEDQGRRWTRGGRGLPAAGRVTQVVSSPAAGTVYATVSSGSLHASSDGGATFTEQSRGSAIRRLAVDPLVATDVWATRADGTVGHSTDAGVTFETVALPARGDADLAGASDQSWREVAVTRDSRTSQAVVALAAAPSADAAVVRVLASVDGGASFLDLPTEGLGPTAGLTFGNSASQLLMVAASDSSAFRGPGLQIYDLGEQAWRDADDEELVGLRDAQPVALDAARRGHEGLFGVQVRQDAPPGAATGTPPVLARYEPADAPSGPLTSKASCVAGGIGAGARPAETTSGEKETPVASFTPDRLRVALQPGRETRVPVRVDLAKVPSPLDVSFLIDSSDSMDPAIAGVQCSVERLVRDLRDRRVDGYFGLGQYNDRVEFRYRRLVDLAPPSKVFTDALEDLRTTLGREETMRTALFQTATGAGLVATPDDTEARPGKVLVAPGQQINFRPEALKLVIVIGDEPYETTTPGEPSVAATVAALRDRGIRAVGVRVIPPVFTDGLNPNQADRFVTRQLTLLAQLQEFARETGAVAPPGGVDCDGGGTPDVRAGDPLVCTVNERGIQRSLGDTIATILAAQQDLRDVRLVPTTTSGLEVRVEDGELRGVDVRRRQSLKATSVLSCSAEQAGRTYPVEYAVMAGAAKVGSVVGEATCGALVAAAVPVARKEAPAPDAPAVPPAPAQSAAQTAAAPPPPTPPAAPQAAAAAAPAPPPPAPVPVASGATANAVSSASASASSTSGAAAASPGTGGLAAAQERVAEQQVAQVRSDGTRELQAVARRPGARPVPASAGRPVVPPAALATFGVGFAGILGWAVVRRGPGRPAPQRVPVVRTPERPPGPRRRRRRRVR